jgi:large subunit ribosomal protein L22
MAVIAKTKDVSVSYKKLKPILDKIRGMNVGEALNILRFVPSPWAREVSKLVKSAVANAENNFMIDSEDLKITEIFSGVGPSMKRFRAAARGRAAPIIRRTSNITIVVDKE